MIKVYLDESGIHADAPVCSVVGYAAPWSKWKRFIPRWNNVLQHFGLEDEGFHAKSFFPRRGTIFRDWTESRTIECFNRLVAVLNEEHPVAVGGCVVMSAFNALNEHERRYITGARYDEKRGKWETTGAPNTPYHLAVQHAIIDSARLGSPAKQVHFIHDQQHQYETLVLERFALLARTLEIKKHLGGIVFSKRMDAVPLQAADMLAYQATEYARFRLAEGVTDYKPNYFFQRLMERTSHIQFFDSHGISLLMEGCPPQFRTTVSAVLTRQ